VTSGRRARRSASLILPSLALAIASCTGGSCASRVQTTIDASPKAAPKDEAKLHALHAFLRAEMERAKYPGMTVAVVRDGEVAWSAAYGFADVEEQIPMTTDAVFYSASIGKTVTATALMQQRDAGKFALDDEIGKNDILPFKVRNPKHPSAPITYRQLLTHRSSLLDTAAVDDLALPGDGKISLASFMRGYLLEGGEYYDDASWSASAPGAEYVYSNAGATLIGYLVEGAAGEKFDAYCTQHVFEPLGMRTTSWSLGGLPKGAKLAMGHRWKKGKFERLPRLGQDPAYPSGALQTTVGDMGRFLAAYSRGGELGGARILAAKTVDEMWALQAPGAGKEEGYGLIWYREEWSGEELIGHSGSYDGFNTEMWLRRSDGVGALVFFNGDESAVEDVPETIIRRLLSEAAHL
jgi:CubicO group peptidase (beta-lactamase class C family)